MGGGMGGGMMNRRPGPYDRQGGAPMGRGYGAMGPGGGGYGGRPMKSKTLLFLYCTHRSTGLYDQLISQ